MFLEFALHITSDFDRYICWKRSETQHNYKTQVCCLPWIHVDIMNCNLHLNDRRDASIRHPVDDKRLKAGCVVFEADFQLHCIANQVLVQYKFFAVSAICLKKI